MYRQVMMVIPGQNRKREERLIVGYACKYTQIYDTFL